MKMILKSVMGGAFVVLATAAVSGAANAVPLGPCGGSGADLLSDYVNSIGASNGNTCTVDGKLFSNFSYSPDGFSGSIAGIPAVPAAVVGVHPATTPDGPGLEFNGAWVNDNTAAIAADATTTFTVTDTGGTSIIDAFLLISGLSGNGAFNEECCQFRDRYDSGRDYTRVRGHRRKPSRQYFICGGGKPRSAG